MWNSHRSVLAQGAHWRSGVEKNSWRLLLNFAKRTGHWTQQEVQFKSLENGEHFTYVYHRWQFSLAWILLNNHNVLSMSLMGIVSKRPSDLGL